MSLVEDVAFTLHEDWRKTRLQKDGSYEPRWKVIKEENFLKNVKKLFDNPEANKPKNISLIDGKFCIDIANSSYLELSSDWQEENKAAAEVAVSIALNQLKVEKSDAELERERERERVNTNSNWFNHSQQMA